MEEWGSRWRMISSNWKMAEEKDISSGEYGSEGTQQTSQYVIFFLIYIHKRLIFNTNTSRVLQKENNAFSEDLFLSQLWLLGLLLHRLFSVWLHLMLSPQYPPKVPKCLVSSVSCNFWKHKNSEEIKWEKHLKYVLWAGNHLTLVSCYSYTKCWTLFSIISPERGFLSWLLCWKDWQQRKRSSQKKNDGWSILAGLQAKHYCPLENVIVFLLILMR